MYHMPIDLHYNVTFCIAQANQFTVLCRRVIILINNKFIESYRVILRLEVAIKWDMSFLISHWDALDSSPTDKMASVATYYLMNICWYPQQNRVYNKQQKSVGWNQQDYYHTSVLSISHIYSNVPTLQKCPIYLQNPHSQQRLWWNVHDQDNNIHWGFFSKKGLIQRRYTRVPIAQGSGLLRNFHVKIHVS